MIKKSESKGRKRLHLICIITLFAIAYAGQPGYTQDYPHNESTAVKCSDCHTSESPDSANSATFADTCEECHSANNPAATAEKTHSSLNTSGKYGAWSVNCITCHDPHEQQQVSKYGSSSYLYSSASTSVVSGSEYSTITRTGAEWTPNQWQGMLVFANTASPSPVFYKINDNTADTLTVVGPLLDIVSGDTFAIVYGALINQTISYTKNNVMPQKYISSPIKFFGSAGDNSFTDGTYTNDEPPVPTQGICVACHTETKYHRNDGTGAGHYAGTDCLFCHRHDEGFKSPASVDTGGSGGGTEGKLSVQIFAPAGVTTTESLKTKNATTAAFDPVTKVCSGIYCHSNGTAAGVASASTPAWGTTFAEMGGDQCAKCHSNSPTGTTAHAAHAIGIHYDNIFTGTIGTAQPGVAAESSHGNATTSTTINCNVCHYNTVQKARNKNNPACANCHSGDDVSTALTRVDIDKRYHVSTGSPDVSFAPAAILSKAQLRDNITAVEELNNSWSRTSGYKTPNSRDSARRIPSYASGSCSTIDCHNGNTISWSAGSLSCKACHTVLPL
jgi:predicted CxxxxCH...CXXCH cytochrome family protein